jgi:hypothetical protein
MKIVNIEYLDKKYILVVKVSFADLALNIENSDEVCFSSSWISSKDSKV